ncbi:MAG: hypothetical protein AB1374_06375 [Bacillota bacterium]
MPRILVKPDALRMLGSQLQQVAGEVQAVELRLSSVMAGLDWEVRSRAGVENQWYNARSLARSTAQCAEAMARFLIYKAQAFEDADRQGAGGVQCAAGGFAAMVQEWLQTPFGKVIGFPLEIVDDLFRLGSLLRLSQSLSEILFTPFVFPFAAVGTLGAVAPLIPRSVSASLGAALDRVNRIWFFNPSGICEVGTAIYKYVKDGFWVKRNFWAKKIGGNAYIRGSFSKSALEDGIKGTKYTIKNAYKYPQVWKHVHVPTALREAFKSKSNIVFGVAEVVSTTAEDYFRLQAEGASSSKIAATVVTDVAVSTAGVVASTAAGAAVGAAIGTFVPVPIVGTVAGAAVGAGVSWVWDEWLMKKTGFKDWVAGGLTPLFE